MTTAEMFLFLSDALPDAGLEFDETRALPTVTVPAGQLSTMAMLLRDHPDMAFDCLMCLSGAERDGGLEAIYHLYSMPNDHKIILRVKVSKEDPVVPSVTPIWEAANWHEREAFDMFGIRFDGHPDLRRILCPDDWEGHPLRKDYQPPLWYHGIPVTVNVPGGATTPDSRAES